MARSRFTFRFLACGRFRLSKGKIEEPWNKEPVHREIGTGGAVELVLFSETGGAVEPVMTTEADDAAADARVFNYKEISIATDSFNANLVIGKGRRGCVYKGFLKCGQKVAVKRFNMEEDMSAELRILTSVKHPNLVKMIGYCDVKEGHFIVYEFMPFQSLSLHLHDLKPGKKPLDWNTRMKIAEGVAKALQYLHDHNDPPVVFGGLNSTDILLDDKYNPKLSDFSCVNHEDIPGHCMMDMKLPEGYIPLEYRMTGKVCVESDIYSFGVVLLELISGRKAVDPSKTLRNAHIVRWARPLLKARKKFKQIADPLMKGKYPYPGLVKALHLVQMCLLDKTVDRPRIAEVVTTLSSLVSNSQIYKKAPGTSEGKPSTPSASPCA